MNHQQEQAKEERVEKEREVADQQLKVAKIRRK